MSPLVWDLGHIAAFEDLWVGHRAGGLRPAAARAGRALRRLRDAAGRPRRAALPAPDRGARVHGGGARALAAGGPGAAATPTGCGTSSSSTSTSTTRRCCRRSSWPSPACSAPSGRPAAGSGGRGLDRACPRGRVRARPSTGRSSPTTTSAQARGGRWAPSPIDRAPVTNGAYLDVRGGRRLPAARAVVARGLGDAPARGLGAAALLDRGRAHPALRPELPLEPRPARDARVVVRGRRLRALARGPAADGGRVGARRAPRPAGRAGTSTSSTSARAPRARSWATAGSGRRASSAATPASSPSRTASTPRCSSVAGTGCCAARSWATRPRGGARVVPQLGPAAAAPDLRRLPLRRGRIVSGRRRPCRSSAATCATRSARTFAHGPRQAAQGAAAEVLLRRARLRAVRPHHVAARVLPDALRAHDPEPPRAGHRGAGRRRGAGGARLGHGLEDARAAVRDGRRRLAAALRALRRGRVGGRRPARSSWSSSTPGWTCTAWWATSGATSSACPTGDRRLFAFLGGTIGNLYPPRARGASSHGLRALMGPRDRLVIGTDLVKDRAILEAAYNDSEGVTAEFNRNVLRVINDGLGRRLRCPRPSSTWPSSTGQLVDRDAAARQRGPDRAHRRRRTSRCASPTARRSARR